MAQTQIAPRELLLPVEKGRMKIKDDDGKIRLCNEHSACSPPLLSTHSGGKLNCSLEIQDVQRGTDCIEL